MWIPAQPQAKMLVVQVQASWHWRRPDEPLYWVGNGAEMTSKLNLWLRGWENAEDQYPLFEHCHWVGG